MSAPHERYREFFETLTPETLARLDALVTADVWFKDPFNDVRGVDAMTWVFRHMFENLGNVTFRVHRAVSEGDMCFMTWTFSATLRGAPWAVEGTSVVRFNDDGRVVEHIDHWDAATGFYERLPLIGWMLRRIRQKIAVR